MYHDGSLKRKFPGEGKRDGSVVAIKIHETNQINNGNNITLFQIQNEKMLGYLDFLLCVVTKFKTWLGDLEEDYSTTIWPFVSQFEFVSHFMCSIRLFEAFTFLQFEDKVFFFWWKYKIKFRRISVFIPITFLIFTNSTSSTGCHRV